MMDHWDSRSSGPEERDLLKELHDSCVKMQPKLLRLAAGLDRNSSFFAQYHLSDNKFAMLGVKLKSATLGQIRL